MTTVLLVFQVIAAIIFVVLMAIQTDKAQQSGVMGLGGQAGRNMDSIDMAVGAERILKPMSKWVAVGFLFLSAMAAMNGEDKLEWWHFPIAIVLYLAVMMLGDKVWNSFVQLFGKSQ